MRYKVLANVIMLLHFAWVSLLIGGTVFIISPNHRWYIPTHLVIVSGTLLMNLFLGFCPLTVWEEKLRKRYDSEFSHNNNFIKTYLRYMLGIDVRTGVIFWVTFLIKFSSYIISVLLLTVFKR